MRTVCWAWLSLLTGLLPARPVVDHTPFDALLKERVKDGRVDYEAVAKDRRLATYMAALAACNPADEPSDPARLALYLNAYNAFVLQGVVANWPLTSVTKVKGFFNDQRFKLGDRELTLDELEADLIRPFGDPRTHAAAVCGARGCAPLRAEAYRADTLEAQLDDQCRIWTTDPGRNRIDRANNVLQVSMIFKWYAEDFEQAGGPAGFLRRYANEEDKLWLAAGGYTIVYLPHDWALNGL